MLDWPSLLRSRGVEFVIRGANVSKGTLAIKCPFCGESDPSQHLRISLRGNWWSCWRNKAHSGKSRARLIEALLRCSFEEARQLAGEDDEKTNTPQDDNFGSLVAEGLGVKTAMRPNVLRFPPECKPMSLRSTGSTPFWEYLYQRGYLTNEAAFIVDQYELRYARMGDWANRLIIPVFDATNKLLTWTGRTINRQAIPRYKSLAAALSVSPASNCLLGLPLLWSAGNPNLLVICEGPFDALRVSALGHERGVYGTCLFGLNASEKQAFQLAELGRRFERIAICLDKDAELSSLRVQDMVRLAGVTRLPPLPVKDPGELTTREGRAVVESWLQ